MNRNRNRNSGDDWVRMAVGFSRLNRPAQLAIGLLVVAGLVIAGVVYLRGGKPPPSGEKAPWVGPASQPPSTPTVPTRPGDIPARQNGSPQNGRSIPSQPNLDSPHLALGNPSVATTDTARADNFLVVRPAYALSFNNSLGTANWVSWRVVRADFGQSPREVEFLPDPDLPPAFKQIGHRDYTGSGFDRGHLCPKGDRGGDRQQAASTFFTSNIVPQAANMNQKAWNNLEIYTRDLVGQKRQRVYVVSGPTGRGGTGLNGYKDTIGNGKVVVPAECWKVVVAIPDSGGAADDPLSVPATARVIAVVMPNDQGKVGHDWATFRTTPAEIERKTKLKFFDRLKPEVAEALRRRLDQQTIPPVDSGRYGRD